MAKIIVEGEPLCSRCKSDMKDPKAQYIKGVCPKCRLHIDILTGYPEEDIYCPKCNDICLIDKEIRTFQNEYLKYKSYEKCFMMAEK